MSSDDKKIIIWRCITSGKKLYAKYSKIIINPIVTLGSIEGRYSRLSLSRQPYTLVHERVHETSFGYLLFPGSRLLPRSFCSVTPLLKKRDILPRCFVELVSTTDDVFFSIPKTCRVRTQTNFHMVSFVLHCPSKKPFGMKT